MKVQFTFLGICTYFNDFASWFPGPAAPPHRMVLVNGVDEPVPHYARLQVDNADDTWEWTEDGELVRGGHGKYELNVAGGPVKISVPGPSHDQGWTNNAWCLPHLQNAIPDGQRISRPNGAVVDGPEGACYVDFTYGTIDGYAVPAAPKSKPRLMKAISIVTIETVKPEVTIAWQDGTVVSGIKLKGDSAQTDLLITISNEPEGTSDDHTKDFALNFKVLEGGTPPYWIPPTTIACPPYCLCQEAVGGDAGPGCSNTDYP